jgi:integrase
VDFDEPATVHISGTLIEPRNSGASTLHRQPYRKGAKNANDSGHRVVLTDEVVARLKARRAGGRFTSPEDPVFSNRRGGYLWPGNVRGSLRRVLQKDKRLTHVHAHLFRSTVATMVAEECGIEVAQALLGHASPATTRAYYIEKSERPVDVRAALDGRLGRP